MLASAMTLLATVLAASRTSAESSYQVLERFRGAQGMFPQAALVADNSGNLYGTTVSGGIRNCHQGCGVVFRVAADGTYKVLYSFQGHGDGYETLAPLLVDGQGTLYGTTERSGAYSDGTAFKLTQDGTKTILHSFGQDQDGAYPQGGISLAPDGNFYGAAALGGANNSGTLFRLAPDGTETTLYSFCHGTTCSGGEVPESRLLIDGQGNLYGTTVQGGDFGCAGNSNGYGCGVVFKYAPNGKYKVLHTFGESPSDGIMPETGLVADSGGNLYGVTERGGINNFGVIYKLTPHGREKILHEFAGQEGAYPYCDLLLDGQGRLVGTAALGGKDDAGVIFAIDTDGRNFKILHDFGDGPDGALPVGAVVQVNTSLYGVTQSGGRGCHGPGCGVVYKFIP
jgi:uncharacterized repeat protein (TIGR03803 family)